MLAAIGHGLGNLLNFTGRDARQAFWYYVLFVYLATVVITMVVVLPMTLQAVVSGIEAGMAAARSSDPEAAQIEAQARVLHSMGGMMSAMMNLSIVTNVLMLAMLAAAFVRRLHDSGLSGLWALVPGGIQVANLVLAPTLMRQMMANLTRLPVGDPMAGIQALQGSIGAASVMGWAVIVVVVVLGLRKSTPGPNRYGEAPFVA